MMKIQTNMAKGKIVKGIGGFYYVDADDVIYECKARGNFRNDNLTPLVGDNFEFSINENAENRIEKIFERKNSLVRPPLANIDILFIICSLVDPKINTLITDRLIAVAEYKNIEPVIVLTKTDLEPDYSEYVSIYENAGFKVITVNNEDFNGGEVFKDLISGKVCAFTGNTGVGKSTLLNNLFPSLELETGETSKKLGRGKHTTRHSELFKYDGGYVADTPGFSSLDIQRYDKIMKEDLPYCFREFREYLGNCRFNSCTHVNDKGCAVCEALDEGKISKSRHSSYVAMFNEVKDIKEWQKK
ncbi:MAG: ribosome small subunit-dependent GTPase A [Eubacterium sp.]|nr:ribosome small subunit-dependent GTPase A [Eubacterium sp.]